jgi:tetratricopeptide (TPR) repeat protein
MFPELLRYISDPKNAEYNFQLGLWYENWGHTAGAAGFYVRAAEYSSDALLSYEALLRIANIFTRQGGRVYMVKGVLLRAISLIPERPEAYFLLSQVYEKNKDWQEAYSFAVMGQRLSEDQPKLRTNVEYPGKYALVYEQAVSAWWIGLFKESITLFKQLQKNKTMLPIHSVSVQDNLQRLEGLVR